MPRTHPAYPPEFRRPMVELVRSGRSIREFARDFECSEQTIRNWLRQADLKEGRRDDGLTSVERQNLTLCRPVEARLQAFKCDKWGRDVFMTCQTGTGGCAKIRPSVWQTPDALHTLADPN